MRTVLSNSAREGLELISRLSPPASRPLGIRVDEIGKKGGTMSDQADSLRQLVRAQRQWREFTLREQPVVVSRPRFPEASLLECGNDNDNDNDDRPQTRGNGIGVVMARVARWAFGRAGVRAD
ncbi:MAG: hypothetical protein WBX00_19805 [Isosphaeraceae bacterium]